MASRSMSWSCRETMALAAEIRSGAGEFGSSAISDMVTADRRRRRTICAGKVALATANTVPVRFSLLLRLFGLTSGVNLSRLGMTDNDRQHTDFNQCLPGDFEKNALRSKKGIDNHMNRFMMSTLIMNMKPKFSLHKHGLRVDFDASEIFPEDPGQGTPVMVYTCGNSATYNCARNEGEVDTVRLTQAQIDWLWEIEEDVWDWFEKFTLAGPCR
jgi:hypothetical protein